MPRRIVSPALWALRTYLRSARLISATAAVGLAALLPVTSLVPPPGVDASTSLRVEAWRGGTLGMSWSSLAWGPGATGRAAPEILFRLLLGLPTGVLAVAALTTLSPPS